MNHGPQDMYYSSHMSAGQPPAPQTVTAGGMGHYSQHQQHPPLLQPGPAQYSPAPGPYSQYPYSSGGLTSPQSQGHQVSGSMGGSNVLPLPAMASQPMQPQYGAPQQGFDTTGQVAPQGMKPRVTATLWEDEGSLCFQVEAKGVCVARREDNHMINGTKLLNVAGMTRGRRDGILKSEKMRHVVKIGPMHLKGVWIPYERALEFANKEKITELLYPLFVHNIGALLYHPTNQTRTNQVMAAAERRKQEQNQMRNTQTPGGLPSLNQHHHHSMGPGLGGHLPPAPQHSIAPHPTVGRPGLDRAHTFPTPPTSASSVMGSMGSSDGNFQWGAQGAMGSGQGTNPLSIDTGLSNARSMPTTPATTPPGNTIQSMQQYQQGSQPYDNSRQMYSAPPPPQNSYPQASGDPNMRQYSQPNPYVKNEMGPPMGRAPGADNDHHDPKDTNSMLHHNQGQGQVGHGHEDEADHDHEAEYTHGNPSSYDANRAPYNYSAPPVGSLTGEHQHLSPEISGSPNHPASGRATPRTTAAPQSYYAQQQQGYNTPPRVQQPPSSNLYNVMSSERGTANGSSADVYGTQSELGGPVPNGYSSQQPIMNGASSGNKRGRDDEDDRPSSRGPGNVDGGLKRRKTIREGSVSGTSYDASLNRPRASIAQRR